MVNYIDMEEFKKMNNKFQDLFNCSLKIENNFIKLFYKNMMIANYNIFINSFKDYTVDLPNTTNLLKPLKNFIKAVEIIFDKTETNLLLEYLSMYIEKKYNNKYSLLKDIDDFPYLYITSKHDGLIEFIICLDNEEGGISYPSENTIYSPQDLKEHIDIYERAIAFKKCSEGEEIKNVF